MIIKNGIIRKKDELVNIRKEIVTALNTLVGHKDIKINIVYEYLHTRNGASASSGSDCIIGYVDNIQLSSNGDIVGDFHINDLLKLANNFTGSIDNIVCGVVDIKGKINYMISNFVIYDRFAKEVIDNAINSKETRNIVRLEDSPIEDSIGIANEENPLMRPDVQESINNAMKDFINK